MAIQRKSPPTQRAFTLIEVLVAIAIFAVVAGISYSTLDSYIAQRERLVGHYGKLERLQRFFILLERDFQSVLKRPVRTGTGIDDPIVTGSGADIITMSVSQAQFGTPLGSTLKRVKWSLDGDKVVRSVWNALDFDSSNTPDERVIEKGVEKIELEYLLYNPYTQSSIKVKSLSGGNYPHGIEVLVTLDSGEEFTRLFEVAKGM